MCITHRDAIVTRHEGPGKRLLGPRSKMPPIKKIGRENHLSPSRRRALCPFFVQTTCVVQPMLQPRPGVGLRRKVAVAHCAKFCREVSALCTAHCGNVWAWPQSKPPGPLGRKIEKPSQSGIFEFGAAYAQTHQGLLATGRRYW